MTEPIPFAGYVDIGEDMTLLEEATKLADDIAEYAPDTNIEVMMRRLIKEVERLTPKPIYEADFVKIAKLKLEAGEE